MTKDQLRTLTRQLLEEYGTEAGTRFPSGDVILDSHIDTGAVIVSCDLMEFDFISFLTSENIGLTATAEYTLTADWVYIWAIQKTGTAIDVLPYIQPEKLPFPATAAANPTHWSLKGRTIIFHPTPNAVQANYARVWVMVRETDDLPEAGPTYIPPIAHRLIAIKAASSAMAAIGEDTALIESFYDRIMAKLQPILSKKVIQLSPFQGEV